MVDKPENAKLRELFDQLRAEKAALAKKSAPLRAKYDALAQKIEPLEAEKRDLAKQIKAIELPRMVELDNTISGLAKLLGGKSMSDVGPAEEQ